MGNNDYYFETSARFIPRSRFQYFSIGLAFSKDNPENQSRTFKAIILNLVKLYEKFFTKVGADIIDGL
ncbi:hypothetical protein GCM10027442_54920 [Emticicia fontis]